MKLTVRNRFYFLIGFNLTILILAILSAVLIKLFGEGQTFWMKILLGLSPFILALVYVAVNDLIRSGKKNDQ